MHYFILGPSGAGKSHIAELFADSINALWLEADIWRRDGIDALSLRTEWDEFLGNNYQAICDEFTRRAALQGKTGVVISLPGFPILTTRHALRTRAQARIIYLTGTPGQCLDSFLSREKKTGRNLGIPHWAQNTTDFFSALERSDISPLSIRNFASDGSYRPFEDVFSEIMRD